MRPTIGNVHSRKISHFNNLLDPASQSYLTLEGSFQNAHTNSPLDSTELDSYSVSLIRNGHRQEEVSSQAFFFASSIRVSYKKWCQLGYLIFPHWSSFTTTCLLNPAGADHSQGSSNHRQACRRDPAVSRELGLMVKRCPAHWGSDQSNMVIFPARGNNDIFHMFHLTHKINKYWSSHVPDEEFLLCDALKTI